MKILILTVFVLTILNTCLSIFLLYIIGQGVNFLSFAEGKLGEAFREYSEEKKEAKIK